MTEQPTCLGLQETKCEDKTFPKELMDLGYHVIVSGQKMNNGVAMFLKTEPIRISTILLHDDQQDCRYIEVEMSDNTVYINVYVPQEQKVGSEKYHYKLKFMKALRDRVEQLDKTCHVVLLGDINIAATDDDMYNPGHKEHKILFLCTSEERRFIQTF